MNIIFGKITYVVDPLHYLWEHEKLHRKISLFLVFFFLAWLLCIELKRQGLITGTPAEFVPYSHFSAIQVAFTMVLILEVISLIFTLPCSFSRSVGKQFELLALILLILTDVLVVLISQCYQPGFYAVFRNSGFALSTMIIRIALAAPPFYNVLLGIAAALFAILLTIVSRKLFSTAQFQGH